MKYDFEGFFASCPEILCVIETGGSFQLANAFFERVLGWRPDELPNQSFFDLVHPEDFENVRKEFQNLTDGNPASFQIRCRCANGSYRYLRWSAALEPEAGLVFAAAHDVTELLETHARLSSAIDRSPAAMLLADARGRILMVNRETERMFGYRRDQLVGQPVETLVPKRLARAHREQRKGFMDSPAARPMGADRVLVAMRSDGSEFPVEIGLNPLPTSDGLCVLGSLVDVTVHRQTEERMRKLTAELAEVNAQLSELASTDQLTGVRNRRAFDEQLGMLLSLGHRRSGSLSLLLVDLDGFKEYNDRHGHLAGDEALTTLAELLESSVRLHDVVGRYGGDEFVVILPDTAAEGATDLGERVRKAVENYAWRATRLTVSVGVSTIALDGGAPARRSEWSTQLFSKADRALYHSKNQGRNRVSHIRKIEISG